MGQETDETHGMWIDWIQQKIRNVVLWARYKLFWFYLSNFQNSFSDNEAKISGRDQWFLSWPTETVIIFYGPYWPTDGPYWLFCANMM